jgi:hypothetical protein
MEQRSKAIPEFGFGFQTSANLAKDRGATLLNLINSKSQKHQ